MSETQCLLVATQISSLFPSSQITSISLRTKRRNTPLPPVPNDSDPPAEHALYSSTLHTPSTGTIVLRVLHGGLVLELISLTTNISPIRFVFPASVLPTPALFVWQGSELHILAVTTSGSVYRLVLPVGSNQDLWQDLGGSNWCREHLIKSVTSPMKGLVQVQGPHCVIVGLPNGSIMRVETEFLGDEGRDDEWTESILQHGSFLSSLTALLPNMHSGPSGGSEVISMATHPQPTDITYVWTLSRDRTIRLWTAKAGCVSAKTLPTSFLGRAGTPSSPSPSHVFLDAERQVLLRTFSISSTGEDLYLLAFIPTPISTTSGGFFQLYKTEEDQLFEMVRVECSANSAHSQLQDFLVAGDSLIVLWDRQGQSTVERTVLGPDELAGLNDAAWEIATYAQEPDLTPSYLDELLLSPGSLTDKFFEAIMRPGMFSALTLRTAIEQYTDACLSLPGPPPPQLRTTYATVGENIAAVVGCTVNLIRDPYTGALQHAKYWNALKRDWEGFIARCREVERSARWPLALGLEDSTGKLFVVERERIGIVAEEDLALQFRRLLGDSVPMDATYTLLDVVWTLRTKLGPQAMARLENQIFELTHQEIGFSMADLLQDEAAQSNVIDSLDDGMQDWILGRIKSIPHIEQAIRTVLDVVGGLDKAIKQEDQAVDDVVLHIPLPQSDFSRALTAAYVATTVQARYDLCLALLLVLFFLSADLPNWPPALLSEIFAVFRGVAMLRSAIRRPAGSLNAVADSTSADDVIARMGNMQVSQSQTRFTPQYSLIHRLLPESGISPNVAVAAHQYLDAGGLLRSTSPAHATDYEVRFCNTLRDQAHYDIAADMLAWLPRTPAVTYVLARLWIDVGRPDDAAYLLEKLAARSGPDCGIWPEDRQALDPVLSTQNNDSQFSFYCHATDLFKDVPTHHVMFSQLALSVAPPDMDTTALWTNLIKGNIALGLFDDAYAALIASPYEKLKRECVSHLTYRMCEEDAVEKLMTYNFAGFADEVEDALSFKSRNVDPRTRPFYSRILYSWFISRGDYRNAALTMYQRARKLHDLINDPSTLVVLAEEQLEAYLVAMNALSLLDRKSAWVSMPASLRTGHESRKRRKLSMHIPEDRFAHGTHDTEIVDLTDMQYEYALLSARLDLLRRDNTVLSDGDFFLSPSLIVLRLIHSSRFNMAMATARSLDVDMTDLFAHLTGQCLRLSRDPDSVIQEDTTDWLLTDRVTSWTGTPADRGWRYLRQSLGRYDSVETDFKYTKVALETILTFDRSSSPPPWLIHSLEEHHHEYLIRTSLHYELFESALEQILSLVRKTDGRLASDPANYASSTWLPYTLIDQVFVATSQADRSPRTKALRQQLDKEIIGHVKRVQKLSQFTL